MLLLKTWRDVLARKGQFAALVMLVTLGIMSYVAFISAYMDLRSSLDTANRELLFADFTTSVAEAPSGVVGRIRRLPGVSRAEGRLVVDTGLDLSDGEQATARVVALPEGRRPRVDDVVVLKGRYLRPGARNEVLLHPKFAGETGLGPGDSIVLRIDGRRVRLRVVGTATASNHLYPIRSKGEIPSPREFAIVYVSSDVAEGLFQRAPTITEVAVHVKQGASTSSVVDEVEHVLDPYTVLETTLRVDEPSNFALNEELEQNRVLAQSMPILILSISALSLFIALSRIVTSQRGEIGLAKALGYSDAQILGHYLLFSLVVAAFGSVLGIGLGLLSARGIAYSYVSLLGIPYLESAVHVQVVLNSVLLSLFACVLAGIVPAWASSRLPPAQAMHSDPNLAVKGGHIPLVERAFGWALPKTFTFRIPLRNVFRARRRSAYTIVGVAFAMVLTVTTVSLFDSVDLLFDKIFTQSEKWDIVAVFEDQFGNDRVNEVERWKGVTRVDPALVLPVEITAKGREHDGALTATAPDAQFHGYDVTSGDAAGALRSGQLVMAESVARKLGVKLGDSVVVDSPYIDDDLTLTVGALSDETLGGPVFGNLDVGRQLAGSARPTFNALYLNSEARYAETLRQDLYDLPSASQVQVKATLVSKLTDYLGLLILWGGILLGFGYLMAFAVIYNTFTANVLERTREIATMRTIGESNSRLAVMITIENLLLAVVGIPLGVWLGLRAADALYAQFSTEAYTFAAVVFPSSVAWVSASLVAVMLLSELPPIRRIFRLDLAEATKVME